MKNIFAEPLQCCCKKPLTGFYRDGYCRTGAQDAGRHTVCAVLTQAFLDFSLSRGNDLITARPEYRFPGLQAGDKWCLCVLRWKEALDAGCAPPVLLEATSEAALEYVALDIFCAHAYKTTDETQD